MKNFIVSLRLKTFGHKEHSQNISGEFSQYSCLSHVIRSSRTKQNSWVLSIYGNDAEFVEPPEESWDRRAFLATHHQKKSTKRSQKTLVDHGQLGWKLFPCLLETQEEDCIPSLLDAHFRLGNKTNMKSCISQTRFHKRLTIFHATIYSISCSSPSNNNNHCRFDALIIKYPNIVCYIFFNTKYFQFLGHCGPKKKWIPRYTAAYFVAPKCDGVFRDRCSSRINNL